MFSFNLDRNTRVTKRLKKIVVPIENVIWHHLIRPIPDKPQGQLDLVDVLNYEVFLKNVYLYRIIILLLGLLYIYFFNLRFYCLNVGYIIIIILLANTSYLCSLDSYNIRLGLAGGGAG